jgi:hypothetical protein
MLRNVLNVPYVEGLVPLGVAAVLLWLFLTGAWAEDTPLRELRDRAALTVTGYLRRPPDCLAENALRGVFAEFDRELALILAERTGREHPDR